MKLKEKLQALIHVNNLRICLLSCFAKLCVVCFNIFCATDFIKSNTTDLKFGAINQNSFRISN